MILLRTINTLWILSVFDRRRRRDHVRSILKKYTRDILNFVINYFLNEIQNVSRQ